MTPALSAPIQAIDPGRFPQNFLQLKYVGASPERPGFQYLITPSYLSFAHHETLSTRVRALTPIETIIKNDHPTYHTVPVNKARVVFEAILEVQQTKPVPFFLSRTELLTALTSLVNENALTPEEATQYDRSIHQGQSFDDFCVQNQDPLTDLWIAQYWCEQGEPDLSFIYVCRAHSNNPRIAIPQEFLSGITTVRSIAPFNIPDSSLVTQMACCPNIKKVALPWSTEYTRANTEEIGKLVTLSKHITSVELEGSPDNQSTMDLSVLGPIAESLTVNQSVTSLKLSFRKIGDHGLHYLLQNISLNTASQLRNLELRSCGITEAIKDLLCEFVRHSPRITFCVTGVETIDTSLRGLVEQRHLMIQGLNQSSSSGNTQDGERFL
ncbi:MAG: hypothetical protein HY069_00630 [Chlamydiia bacterium]|nr:hypothetical protein [Chlamydiia bacterium]